MFIGSLVGRVGVFRGRLARTDVVFHAQGGDVLHVVNHALAEGGGAGVEQDGVAGDGTLPATESWVGGCVYVCVCMCE